MNQEIEYAEMLEIPVSTVNVVHKKQRKKWSLRGAKNEKTIVSPPSQHEKPAFTPTVTPQTALETPLKESVIAQVNDRVEQSEARIEQDGATAMNAQASLQTDGAVRFDPIPERIDTVRLYAEDELRDFNRNALRQTDEEYGQEMENPPTMYALNTKNEPSKAVKIILGAEFAAACVLCGAIFFTNVFMPNSGINTFFRGVTSGAATETTNNKSYNDFVLSSIVSDFSDVTLSLSENGVLSFTEECCVYPAADGSIAEIIKDGDEYTMKIRYSDTFTGVFSGLDHVFYQVGDKVKSNVPVGYSGGETEVQVTMYSSGELLNCFRLTEENCIAWITE